MTITALADHWSRHVRRPRLNRPCQTITQVPRPQLSPAQKTHGGPGQKVAIVRRNRWLPALSWRPYRPLGAAAMRR